MEAKKIAGSLHNLSVSELARRTQIDKSCWSRYFNGEFKPSTANLIKISKALHLTVDEVLIGIQERRITN